jgi:hypothetical protein
MKLKLHRPSPALVVAMIALFARWAAALSLFLVAPRAASAQVLEAI